MSNKFTKTLIYLFHILTKKKKIIQIIMKNEKMLDSILQLKRTVYLAR